jgi:hypothetical protein
MSLRALRFDPFWRGGFGRRIMGARKGHGHRRRQDDSHEHLPSAIRRDTSSGDRIAKAWRVRRTATARNHCTCPTHEGSSAEVGYGGDRNRHRRPRMMPHALPPPHATKMNQSPYQSPPLPSTKRRWFPVWGVLSVVSVPLALALAVGVTWAMESLFGSPLSESATLPKPLHLAVGRAIFAAMRVLVVAGVVSAFIALVSRERPPWLPIVGLLTAAIFVGLLLSDSD